MRFYTKQHKFYCGIDFHAKKMYLCNRVTGDVLHIFIIYLIQLIETENMMNVPDYSAEVIIATFQICKYEERLLLKVRRHCSL